MPPAIKYDEIWGSTNPRMLRRRGCSTCLSGKAAAISDELAATDVEEAAAEDAMFTLDKAGLGLHVRLGEAELQSGKSKVCDKYGKVFHICSYLRRLDFHITTVGSLHPQPARG